LVLCAWFLVRPESVVRVNWDLDPTRDRIVVIRPATSAAASAPKQEHTVMILKNFLDELRRRVPTN